MKPTARWRYILSATLGYGLFAALWIFLSDQLLVSLADTVAIQWLSTAKGMFFVVVTTVLLLIALRGVPPQAGNDRTWPEFLVAPASSPWARGWGYLFAVVVTVSMLAVRSGIAASFGDRPLLNLFGLPLFLSALIGGLGPGLVATITAALGLAYLVIPPQQSFQIASPYDLFQWAFLIANGVLVSCFSEVLHRLRRQTEVARQLHAVTLASIGDGVISTDTKGRVTFMNHEAERLTGWSNREALGLPLDTVFRVVDEESRLVVDNPVARALATGQSVGLAQHMLLLGRDGREWPIQDSGAPIRLNADTILGGVLVFRDDSERKRSEQELRDSLAEKVVLLKEVHHRVKNNLQIVSSLLSLQADRMTTPEAAAALLDTQDRVRSMALLHESLYRSGNLARINIPAYIQDLCSYLLSSLGQKAERVQVEQRVVPLTLAMEQAVPCGLIINELVSNALKHGFPGGRPGTVTVELAREDEAGLLLCVMDNGIGLPPGIDAASSGTLGLMLVRNLTGQLGGSLSVEQPPTGGVLFAVRFLLPHAERTGGAS